MSVWITRSAPDNLRTARGLRALGQRALVVPVLTTVARPRNVVLGRPDAIVFSSVHAVRHFRDHARFADVPVFAASGPIADTAATAGYVTITSTADDEDTLLDLMAHALPSRAEILHVRGASTSPRVREQMAATGRRVVEETAYEAVPLPDGDIEHARDALGRVDAIVVHSRGGAARVASVIADAGWRGAVWCISEQARRAMGVLPGVRLHTAQRPTESSLLQMAALLSAGALRRATPPRRQSGGGILTDLLEQRFSASPQAAENANDAVVSPPSGGGPTVA